jgi:hypothetical protein
LPIPFEVFVEGYLATHQKLQAEAIWLVGQVPQGIRQQDFHRAGERIPCLECQELRAMRVRARIGTVVLAARRGDTLPALSERDLLRGCCKRADEAASSVTIRIN